MALSVDTGPRTPPACAAETIVARIVLLLLLSAAPLSAHASALDRYIAKADPVYGYELYHVDQTLAYTSYFLRMTSQQWRSADEVDRPVWEHEVQITIPALVYSASPETALLIVNGGANDGPLNNETGTLMATLAGLSGSVVAMINQVPNQPLYFADESNNPRIEDAILAYSLDKFLDTGDEEWPVHLAMTKAVVRAMDTVQAFLGGRSIPIDDYIVLGGSKRGWTTWLTAAVDPRVKAIIPISIDLLNMEMQFIHHWEAYGFYTPAIGDYVELDLPCRLLSDRGQQLLGIIDPYAYRERYSMPKLVINSAGDEFFAPDSSRFYFRDLLAPARLRYTFNTDHSQGESDEDLLDVAIGALLWIDDVNRDDVSEPFSWRFEEDGSIRVEVDDRPDAVNLVQATNPFERDFRLETLGAAWTRTPLSETGDGVYIGAVSPPAAGFTAFAVELVYNALAWPDNTPVREVYTTDIRIAPDILPYKPTACAAETTGMTNIEGTVGIGETPICALVLSNGRRKFSCGTSQGRFQMAVPLDEAGGVSLFSFADGFSPYSVAFLPMDVPVDVQMSYESPDDPEFVMPVISVEPTDRPDWLTISGNVVTLAGQPVCALVLANGQDMFSCGESLGRYELTVPLDAEGSITVFGFADGFRIWRETLTVQ
jgi:PhoPQ-activated pathogenicity-related protein